MIAELDLTAKLNKKKPRKVYLYKEGNMGGVREERVPPSFN